MSQFSKELLTNKAISDMSYGFNPLAWEVIASTKETEQTGAIVEENGDVRFHIYAPDAKRVQVRFTVLENAIPLELEKSSTGFFDATLPYRASFAGPKAIDYIVDGTVFLHPYTPIYYGLERPINYVEIPDQYTNRILLKNVLHGAVTKEIYFSEAIGEWEQCIVYTPPGYQSGEDYPVLYLQHGHTENELSWVYNGKLNYMLDNLLAELKCVPFIVVMNDGMVRKKGDKFSDFSSFEKMLLQDCIPFIENTYHVRKDKWSRAMAGLSMGSMQTSIIGLTHPKLFGYLGLFSGFMTSLLDEDPHNYEEKTHLSILKNDLPGFEKEFQVFFRSVGELDDVNANFYKDDIFCEKYKVNRCANYYRRIYPNQYHDWGGFRCGFYDFAQLIFKEKK